MNQVNILHHIFVFFHSFKYKIHSLSDDKRKDAINSLIEKQKVGRKQTGCNDAGGEAGERQTGCNDAGGEAGERQTGSTHTEPAHLDESCCCTEVWIVLNS